MRRTDEEIVSTVSSRSHGAYLSLAQLLQDGTEYPGDIKDVMALTSEMSKAAFAYPVAAFAWAYLAAHGIANYPGNDRQITEFVNATLDGSLWGRAYR